MTVKVADHGSSASLDFGRLLGFKRVAAFAGSDALTGALGAVHTKVGEPELAPPVRATPLAAALGAKFNKAGEVDQPLATALAATFNKVGAGEVPT